MLGDWWVCCLEKKKMSYISLIMCTHPQLCEWKSAFVQSWQFRICGFVGVVFIWKDKRNDEKGPVDDFWTTLFLFWFTDLISNYFYCSFQPKGSEEPTVCQLPSAIRQTKYNWWPMSYFSQELVWRPKTEPKGEYWNCNQPEANTGHKSNAFVFPCLLDVK